MADVLAIPGVPEPWMAYPKEYTYSSAFGDYDKQLSSSPTDWYSIFCPSTSTSSLNFQLLHHPPTIQTQRRPRKLAKTMMNRNSLPGNSIPLAEDKRYMPLHVEDPHMDVYSQGASPFTTRLDLNSANSSNGSTYCESDLESLEHFDEPFTTRNVETHTGLAHPAPQGKMFTMASNSFLLGTGETPPLSSFEIPDVKMDEHAFSTTQFNCQNPTLANYPTGRQVDPHSSITPQDTKPLNYGGSIQWLISQPPTTTEAWYPTPDLTSPPEDSWHTQDGYNLPWPATNTYNYPAEYNEPEPRNGLPMEPFGPAPLSLGPNSPIGYISHLQDSGPYQITNGPEYQPGLHRDAPTQPPISDTEYESPDQNPASSFSPSFSVSTTEGRSRQQSEEEQGGTEATVQDIYERNAFLIDCKSRGLSYKEIKRLGGFKEAESTLRGRYRTLTKSKDQRVRKPAWHDRDMRLLCQAVAIHAERHDTYNSLPNSGLTVNEPPKVSWKKVSDHIWANGGSYHFGNATCKKKWCEIHDITI
ncbi:hypothetical protein DTO027I6_8951 [Penicillium roqueforti]|nr:hypothetical protein CBS147337_9074 [Penicillium roqueforti]KAI3118901.1 hypothetical protein CBS147330_8733 [Penicillium roqueforti]KAI3146865.1 hypothetical protein CBS147317_9011 [Penicillium roqueforti]KAI3188559.1 hypothetical protein DTO027I6_8951 [Penicillium roqueforti]